MNSHPDDTLVQLKSLEALKDIANGEATKYLFHLKQQAHFQAWEQLKKL